MLGLVFLWSLLENCSVHAAQINLTHVPGWSLQDGLGSVSLGYPVKQAATLVGQSWPVGMLVMMRYTLQAYVVFVYVFALAVLNVICLIDT